MGYLWKNIVYLRLNLYHKKAILCNLFNVLNCKSMNKISQIFNFLSKRLRISKWALLGDVFPCSHSETFLAVTPKSSANFTCVSFISLHKAAMSSAVTGFSGSSGKVSPVESRLQALPPHPASQFFAGDRVLFFAVQDRRFLSEQSPVVQHQVCFRQRHIRQAPAAQ